MHESEHLFYSLIQNSSDIITILKEDGIISYESPSLQRLLGYAPDELIGRNAFELIHPDDLPKARAAFAEVIRTPDVPLSTKFRFRHKDGSWRVLEATGSNQLQNAMVSGIVVNSRDVTKRTQAEELLRESEERFRRIFNDGPLGMIIADPDFKILKANRAVCEMLEYAEADLPGHSIKEITHLQDRETSINLLIQLLHGEVPLYQLEKRYIKKNEETLWANLTVTAIRGQKGEVLYALGMVENISRRKLAEQERERLVRDLQYALDKAKTLHGLLPMCAWCKKIRNDKGYWQRVETYVQEHSGASFTHGICPECLNKVDPATAAEVFENDKEGKRLKPERRRFERRPFTEAGNYRFRLKEAKGQSVLNAVIHDISDAGMCIRTDYPLEHSWVVVFNDEAGEKTGIVKWKEKVSVDDNACRAGIEFLRN
jgi:PAS domain S-box-containing protein